MDDLWYSRNDLNIKKLQRNIFSNSQDDKMKLALLSGSGSQRVLPSTGGSGKRCICLSWTPSTPWSSRSGMGRPRDVRQSVQRYKNISMVTCTDKH